MGRYKIDSLDITLTVTAKQTANSLNKITKALHDIKSEASGVKALEVYRKELVKFSRVDLTPIAGALDTIARSTKNARKHLEELYSDTAKMGTVATPDFLPQEASPKNVTALGSESLAPQYNKATVATIELASAQGVLADNLVRVAGAEAQADMAASELKRTFAMQSEAERRSAEEMNRFKASLRGTIPEISKTDHALKRLHKSHSRLVRYASYRLIRGVFNGITNSFKNGLKSAYDWSVEAKNGFTDLSKTIDGVLTSSMRVRSQLGALEGEFIQNVSGLLNGVLDTMNEVAKSLTQFFAALAGRDTYMVAKEVDVTWQQISGDEEKAAKEAKKYKQILSGFDELNILTKHEEEKKKTADYEMLPVDYESAAAKLAVDIKDVLFNWDDLDARSIGLKICAGLGAATGGVIGFALGGVGGAIIGTITGFIVGIKVGEILFDTTKAEFTPETAKQDIINTVIGGAAGAAIGFAVGGPFGAAVGLALGVGITLLVNEFSTTYEERIFEEYQKTEFWERYREFMDEKLPAMLAKDEEITARIKGITLDLNDAEVTNLETARDLIIEIFDMDAIENKTPEQIAELKTKIETLNGMNLDGVRIEFDELTGAVTTSKDELLAHVDAMISNAKVQAGMEKYIELLKIAKDAELEKINRDKELKNAQDNQKSAYRSLADAQKRYDESTAAIAAATELAQQKYGLYHAELVLGEEAYKNLCEEQEQARQDIDTYTLAVNKASEEVSTYEDEIQKMIDKKDEAVENANIMLGLVNDEKAAINKETKAYQKNEAAIGELESAMTDAETELADLEKQTGVTTDSFKDLKTATNNVVKASPKLQEAMNKCKGVFNDVKSAIAGTISELGKLDEAGKTKRTIELEYAVGANMSDAAMLAMYKGVTGKTFASGGFPEGGHLFFANENGNPEYIGNMGGRTAVANSDQMSAAIEEASYRGMARALSQYGGNKNSSSDWQPMSAQDMYLLLKRTSNNESRRTGATSFA